MARCMKNEIEWRGVDTHNVDNEVCQLPRIVRRQIVPPALDKEHTGIKLTVEVF